MRRPAWAAAPGFSVCWSAVEQGVARADERFKAFHSVLLRELALAHVVVVEQQQVKVLPRLIRGDLQDLAPHLRHVRLPFDPLFVDVGGVNLQPYTAERYEVVGGLCTTSFALSDTWRPLTVFPFGRLPTGQVAFTGNPVCLSEDGRLSAGDPLALRRFPEMTPEEWGDSCEVSIDASERVIAVLSWLESGNVDLVEASLSPKQRKRELKKGRQIALTVQVRKPKTKPISRNGKANYSHRFEVAGHYMHFPEGTRLADADPTKLSFVPGRGFVRKIWCPPHVKGPEDRPLVPKVRIVSERGERGQAGVR